MLREGTTADTAVPDRELLPARIGHRLKIARRVLRKAVSYTENGKTHGYSFLRISSGSSANGLATGEAAMACRANP